MADVRRVEGPPDPQKPVADAREAARQRLIANLLDGLNSGPGIVVDENTFKDMKKRLLEKLDRAGEQPRDERRAS